MTDAPELLPCPFCGEQVTMNNYTDKLAAAWVLIHWCKAIGPIKLDCFTGISLAAEWNTRADLHAAALARAEMAEAQLARVLHLMAEGMRAFDTGRNEPLQVWRDQTRAALNPETPK